MTIRNYLLGVLLLLVGLAVSLRGAEPAPAAAAARESRPAQADSRNGLTRSMGEFIAEIDLFDNHLYGRVETVSGDTQRAESLRGQIQSRNTELKNLMDNPPPYQVREGGNNYMTTNSQEYFLAVYNLENEISGMISRLRTIENGGLPLVATELLDGSMWREPQDASLLDPNGEDLGRELRLGR
ncbi:hypothetical protein LLH00_03100 [bacterium]|nr:hypothetical protein [bacterium]